MTTTIRLLVLTVAPYGRVVAVTFRAPPPSTIAGSRLSTTAPEAASSSTTVSRLRCRQVHERLVDGERLDRRREGQHRRPHRAADGGEFVHVGFDRHGVGAGGCRRPLSGRLYLAGEIEGAFHFNGEVAGFLEGTGEDDRDVGPGAWTVDRRCAVGLNARLGYVPASLAFPGPERSLYLFAGPRRIDAGIEAAHVNRRLGIAGSRYAKRTPTPWLAGVGVEFGDAGGRFDLRLSYAADDPRLGYAFELRDWSVSLGYVVPLGD